MHESGTRDLDSSLSPSGVFNLTSMYATDLHASFSHAPIEPTLRSVVDSKPVAARVRPSDLPR